MSTTFFTKKGTVGGQSFVRGKNIALGDSAANLRHFLLG
jgi:hypothetical protein